MNADQSKYYEDQIAQLLKERDRLLAEVEHYRKSNDVQGRKFSEQYERAEALTKERDDLARRCDFAKDPEMAHDDELGWMHKDSLDEVNALRAKVAEMRDVLDAIWDRDELSATRDPEDESGCGVCPECEAHLPHGGHSTDCITGKIDHAKSGDCGKGWRSPEEYAALEAKVAEMRNYILDVIGHFMAIAHGEPVENLFRHIETNGNHALSTDCGRGYVPVSEIHGPLFALHQYCMNHPENIRDLPDEIWLPFCGVLCAIEKLKEGK